MTDFVKMNIIVYHRTFADGAEGIHVSEITNSLKRLGHKVDVLSLVDSGGNVKKSNGNQTDGFLQSVVKSLKRITWVWEVMQVLFNIYAGFLVWKGIIRRKPDVVYKRHSNLDVSPLAVSRMMGVPTILEVNCLFASKAHQNMDPVFFTRVTRIIEKWAFSLADKVLVVSSPLRQQLIDMGVPKEKILLQPNGADPLKFNPESFDPKEMRDKFDLHGKVVVGWTGILRKWHDLGLLVEVIEGVKNIYPDVRLLLIGDGPERTSLERLAKHKGVENEVIFVGRVPHGDIPLYLSVIDIAVASGDLSNYASPMKILEYMAMRKPVLAPRMKNIEDILSDKEDGLLFTPGDSKEFKEKLLQLIRDESLRLRLGKAGREKVVKYLNWDKIAENALLSLKGNSD